MAPAGRPHQLGNVLAAIRGKLEFQVRQGRQIGEPLELPVFLPVVILALVHDAVDMVDPACNSRVGSLGQWRRYGCRSPQLEINRLPRRQPRECSLWNPAVRSTEVFAEREM